MNLFKCNTKSLETDSSDDEASYCEDGKIEGYEYDNENFYGKDNGDGDGSGTGDGAGCGHGEGGDRVNGYSLVGSYSDNRPGGWIWRLWPRIRLLDSLKPVLCKVKLLDNKLNKQLGYQYNILRGFLNNLLHLGSVEVKWREACYPTDITQDIYKEWVKIVTMLRKNGLNISEEPIKHKNAYEKSKNGFWNSILYKLF